MGKIYDPDRMKNLVLPKAGLMIFVCPAMRGTNEKDKNLCVLRASVVKASWVPESSS